jgi:hypothetical protein
MNSSSSVSDGTEAETDFFVSNGLEPCVIGKEGRQSEVAAEPRVCGRWHEATAGR